MNGTDLVQDCIRMYLESKMDKPQCKVDLCDSVLQFLNQLYPEVQATYGQDVLKTLIDEKLGRRVLRSRKRCKRTDATVSGIKLYQLNIYICTFQKKRHETETD